MANDPADFARLRTQFVAAAARHEPAGYRTFIERGACSEEASNRSGRDEFIGWIHWPYKPWRKCMILAPNTGSRKAPFSVVRKLGSKAWLLLPLVVREGVVHAAERHLAERSEFVLSWARFDYQFWIWLLWFDWFWQLGAGPGGVTDVKKIEELEHCEAEHPSAGMDLRPFSSSADLIARWGLDGAAPRFPIWVAENIPKIKRPALSSNGHRYSPVPKAETTEQGLRDKLADELTKQGWKIVQYLLEQRNGASFDTLAEIPGAFRGGPTHEAILKALKRVEAYFNKHLELNLQIKIDSAKSRAKLIRPPDSLSDK